jgi:hypothetical protein
MLAYTTPINCDAGLCSNIRVRAWCILKRRHEVMSSRHKIGVDRGKEIKAYPGRLTETKGSTELGKAHQRSVTRSPSILGAEGGTWQFQTPKLSFNPSL